MVFVIQYLRVSAVVCSLSLATQLSMWRMHINVSKEVIRYHYQIDTLPNSTMGAPLWMVELL
ncbi:MAG: hypothetical protein RTS72_03475, partial [Candidatus Thorarchaeota archaeon]